MNRPLVRTAHQRPLDAAVLIAQRNLQVGNMLAVALEAEMARIEHAGVYRSDRHLVDFFAFHAEEFGDRAEDLLAHGARPGVVARAMRGVETNRLEPRMADRYHAPLLGDFTLEPM